MGSKPKTMHGDVPAVVRGWVVATLLGEHVMLGRDDGLAVAEEATGAFDKEQVIDQREAFEHFFT